MEKNQLIFILAILITVALPFAFMLLGLIIQGVSNAITTVISMFLGGVIGFAVRNYVTYVGVVHHEFAHALLAFITGAKIKKITLIPKGATLGSVEFAPRGYKVFQSLQLTLSSIAPVICGTISLFIMWKYILPHCSAPWHYIIFFYVFISILFHADLSLQDISNALKGLPLTMLVVFGLSLVIITVVTYL
ncbi:MAG: hypothetical protein K6F99_00425 [Lachnospiraceae bacterium]|nr:hypothetical protein [Lachnospiraceae bacterium]